MEVVLETKPYHKRVGLEMRVREGEKRRSTKISVFEDVLSQVLGSLLVAGWFSFLSHYSHMTRVQKSIWQWSRNNFFCVALSFSKICYPKQV